MFDLIKQELKQFNIELVSCLNLDECTVKRAYLLERAGISSGSVVIFAVPYLTPKGIGERNVSSYAVSKDYHLFFSSLFENIIKRLKSVYPQNKFAGFTDHSPIDEIHAGALAGLGVIGKNHLLITEKYSSYVFIGEIITDMSVPSRATEAQHCLNCGKCVAACPVSTNPSLCLSALTQKKTELDGNEIKQIAAHGCAWGCDICQEVCPHTQAALANKTIFTEVDFFKDQLLPSLSSEQIEEMPENDFSQRAYSWRGKKTIIRNLKILEGKEV